MKCFWSGAEDNAPSTSAVNYTQVTDTQLSTYTTAEASRTLVISEDIVVTKFTVWCTTAPTTGNSFTYTLRDDGVNTAAAVTISDTNTTASWSGSVSIAALSLIALQTSPTGTPTAPGTHYWTIEYYTAGNFYLIPGGNSNVGSTSATNYFPIFGGYTITNSTVATDFEVLVPTNATVINLAAALDGAPGSGKSMAFSLRQNNTTDVLTATVANTNTTANATGSVAIAPTDTLVMKMTPSGTPGFARAKTCLTVVPSAAGEIITAFGYTTTPSTSAVNYQVPQGPGLSSFSSTEGLRQLRLPACKLSKLYARCDTAPGGSAQYVLAVRSAAGATGITTTIAAAATTGNDTTHTFDHGDGNFVSMQITPSTTPAASTMRFSFVMAVRQPSADFFQAF